GQIGYDAQAARRADHRQTSMTLHQWRDHRQVDLVMFADRLGDQTGGQGAPTPGALLRIVVHGAIEIFTQAPAVAFMTRLGATRARLVPLCLAIRRTRLGRCARCLPRLRKAQHKLDQLGLAQKLKIGPAHTILNQRSPRSASGWVITRARPSSVFTTSAFLPVPSMNFISIT